MKKRNKKSLIIKSLAIAIGLFFAHSLLAGHSNTYIRDRVVKLTSVNGSCSGEQVRAPSGVDYILTAAHCIVMAEDGSIMVTTEDGRKLPRRIIQEDAASDLLLLEGLPGLKGLEIAKSNRPADEIRTFTHGAGLDTYETSGVIIQDKLVIIGDHFVETPEEIKACIDKPKYKALPYGGSFMCALHIDETMITANVVPGSSGGPVVDKDGLLTGVVSAKDSAFGYMVRLSDIHKFLNNY